jgi:hypothetical protein
VTWNIFLLASEHRKGRREHERVEKLAMEAGGVAASVNVRTQSTFKRRSGSASLKDDTKHRVMVRRGKSILRLSWDKKYAAAIDHGAVKHEIHARRAPYLRFYWPKLGHWVSLKMVNHPGNKPYRFGFHAQKAAYHELGQRLRFGMNRLSRKF